MLFTKKYFFYVLLFFHIPYVQSASEPTDLDISLDEYIKTFNFSAVERQSDFKPALIKLGSKLYGDMRLSLTGDKSCFTCHLDFLNSGDDLPLSLGVGTTYTQGPSGIYQNTARTTKRNATNLYNKGHIEFKTLFADGRVNYQNKKWTTPDSLLNNSSPLYKDILAVLNSSMSAQALFPMVDPIEMKGEDHEYLSNLEVWDKITQSLVSDPNLKRYFTEAYPQEKINIAHIGNALAHFQKYYFQVTETNWDKYLRGDQSAMTDQEKRGAILFAGKAKCANCHNGKHLTNFQFENTAIPGVSQDSNTLDQGRFDFTGKKSDRFKTIVSPLRNIGKTKPYFTSGIVLTLKDVIHHYNDPINFYLNYTPLAINSDYIDNFEIFTRYFIRTGTLVTRTEQLKTISNKMPLKLHLTEDEMKDLESFLSESLTEKEDIIPADLLKHVKKESWRLPL